MSTKVKIQIEVTEDYADVFGHKHTAEIDKFSKSAVLDVLNDVVGDLKMLVLRSAAMQKVEDKHLLTQSE